MASSDLPDGLFETERDAICHPAVQEVYEAGNLADASHRMIERACTAAGVRLGAYDHQVVLELSRAEPQACAVIAGMIIRAHQAGSDSTMKPRVNPPEEPPIWRLELLSSLTATAG